MRGKRGAGSAGLCVDWNEYLTLGIPVSMLRPSLKGETMIRNTLFRRAMGMAVAGAFGSTAWAQISIGSAGFSYTQNFNGLASSGTGNSWANNSTITGWSASGSFGGNYAASDGSVITGTGDLYSFGTGSGSDRALGSAAISGTGNTGTIRYGVLFQNTSGAPISRIHVSYTGEQWRVVNQAAQSLTFEYKIAAASIGIGDASFISTGATGLNFTGPKASLAPAALDGNAAANRTLITVSFPVTLANNSYIFLRWTDNTSSAGNSHFLGIDDLFVSVPEAGTWGAGLGLFGLLGWTMVRRGRGSR